MKNRFPQKLKKAVHIMFTVTCRFLSRNFFRGIYYVNFFCYANCSIVLEPNFRGGQKSLNGQTASGAPPCGRKPA